MYKSPQPTDDAKVILLSEVFPPATGGSGRWLFEIYRRFSPHEVTAMVGIHPRQNTFDAAHEIPIHRCTLAYPSWGFFDYSGFSHYWRTYRQISRFIKKNSTKAIHCGKPLPEGWLAWLLQVRYGVPFWVFVHGEELALARQSRQLTWMMHRVFHRAQGIIANSYNTSRLLQHDWNIASSQIHVIHPGVDTQKFSPKPPDIEFLTSYGWRDRRVILTVGRLQRRKGHDMLIKALPQIRSHCPNVLYSIVGDGEERASLIDLARQLQVENSVQFLGEAADDLLVNCYQNCDVFVLPNRDFHGDFEGFGMVLVEAQSCGKPVVAGNSGGTAETMEEPHTGIRVDCDSPGPLAATLISLLQDDSWRAQMGKCAREWAIKSFAWDQLADRMSQAMQIPLRNSKPSNAL